MKITAPGSNGETRYAFLIGAAKCGTTALADMLDDHPGIDVSKPKEPDYFTDRVFVRGRDWYQACFDQTRRYEYRLDASVSYSAGWGGGSRGIAERIGSFAPNAKIIYVVRDPVERTRSAYWHAVRSGYEQRPLWDAIHDPAADHITASRYTERIDDYRQFFPDNRILIVPSVELKTKTLATLNRIVEFLGLAAFHSLSLRTDTNQTYQLSPIGKVLHSVLSNDVVKAGSKLARRHAPSQVWNFLYRLYTRPIPALTDDEAAYLVSIFRDEVAAMQKRYGIDLRTSKWWRA